MSTKNSSLPETAESPFRSAEQRKIDRDAKREALLHAAVRMFNTRGFHATSLDDVAASLGVSKPTIYHYLGNKDRVLLECLSFGLNRLLKASQLAKQGAGRTGAEQLEAFLVLYAEVMMSDFGKCVARTPEEALSEDSIAPYRELKRRIDEAMRDLIRAGIEDGSIAPVDVRSLAFLLAGALNWPGRWFDDAGPSDAASVARTLVDMLARGYLPRD